MKKKYCWKYHHFTHVYQKPQSYEVQFLKKKMKKASGDVIISNLCNKKHDHMLYAYSDMECDRHNFLLFFPTIDPKNLEEM